MENAEQAYTRVFWWFLSRWANLDTFRQLAKDGLSRVIPRVHATTQGTVAEWLTDGSFEELFICPEGMSADELVWSMLRRVGGADGLVSSLASATIQSQEFAIDAASLVFAHTILDTAAHEFCRIVFLVSPRHLAFLVKRKQVTLEDVEASSYDELLAVKVGGYLSGLEKESLLCKLDVLHKLCQPDTGFESVPGYRYDRGRIEGLDTLRHDLVHGRDVLRPLPHGDDDLEYLKNTTTYAFAMINHRFGVLLSPDYLKQVLKPGSPLA